MDESFGYADGLRNFAFMSLKCTQHSNGKDENNKNKMFNFMSRKRAAATLHRWCKSDISLVAVLFILFYITTRVDLLLFIIYINSSVIIQQKFRMINNVRSSNT